MYRTDKTALLLIVTTWRFAVIKSSRTNSLQDKRKNRKCEHFFDSVL